MDSQQESRLQVLVRFCNRSTVVYLPQRVDNGDEGHKQELLSLWSSTTGWPLEHLKIASWELPFVTITARSSIRGGKGGFGTLLKGQSRQAGAKLTTDFGACRDLQGRRLRHVNDEIKLRKWREMKRREQAGEKVPDDELWKTPSGIYNWHLMTPTWADVSKKATHRIKRQFHQLNREAQKEALKKQEQEVACQNSMTHYLEKATTVTEKIQQSIPDAIQQGLAAAAVATGKRKRRRHKGESSLGDDLLENAEPNSLVTLSGEFVVNVEKSSSGMEVQSLSDFGTAVLVLDRASTDPNAILYYEVTLETGGLAQIGWATLMGETPFAPKIELGDGAGDDTVSFAVDGSRKLKFHGGDEKEYPIEWKQGDRLGCWLKSKEGTIGFSLNGEDCGEAFRFDVHKGNWHTLVPAFSCNQGEILQLHTTKTDCKFFPVDDAVAVGDLVESGSMATPQSESTASKTELAGPISTSKLPSKPSVANVHSPIPEIEKKEPTKPEHLDLDSYKSVEELKELGLDRLKSALLALQVKCGGTLAERAERLFSLKGLSRKDYPKKVRANGFRE